MRQGLLAGHMQSMSGDRYTTQVEALWATARRLEADGQLRHTPPPPSAALVADLAQAERRARFAVAADEDDEPTPPLDPVTAQDLSAMAALPSIPEPDVQQEALGRDASMWVCRRYGYDESTNPNHMVLTMAGDGSIIGGPVTTAALDPTAVELLQFVAANCTREGQRPRSVHTDCVHAVKGMKTALSEMGITVRYYPPPSSEEMAVAQSR